LIDDLSKLEDKKMFVNPMDSLPGYGAILKNHFKLNVEDEERCRGDMIAAVLDYLIGIAWRNFGLFPKEEEKHRKGTSIMEIQSFLDWAVPKLIDGMEFTEAQKDEINKEYVKAIQEFIRSGDEEETDVT
jgi:hypothetical protein